MVTIIPFLKPCIYWLIYYYLIGKSLNILISHSSLPSHQYKIFAMYISTDCPRIKSAFPQYASSVLWREQRCKQETNQLKLLRWRLYDCDTGSRSRLCQDGCYVSWPSPLEGSGQMVGKTASKQKSTVQAKKSIQIDSQGIFQNRCKTSHRQCCIFFV